MNAPQPLRAAAPPPASADVRTRLPRTLLLNRKTDAAEEEPADSAHDRRAFDINDYARLPAPAVVVYRLGNDRHQQTGIVVEISIEDYRNGRIRRHEATRPDRERHLHHCTETTGIERMPVVLAHPESAGLRSLLTGMTSTGPDVDRTSPDGTTHTLWIRHDAELANAVQAELGRIAPLYIADGHHRMAAAERCAERRRHLGRDHASAFTLAALFPKDEMRLLGHHRCLPLRPTTSTADVLARLATHPMTAWIGEVDQPEAARPGPGLVVIHLDGRCYQLRLRARRDPDHVRASLDVVALDEELLPQLEDLSERGGSSPATDNGDAAGESWCGKRKPVRFLPHPPSIEQVMAISDAGLLLPPKSTWFEPKASAGLFARELT